MNYLLKIVEGPNKGAEIALPDGVAVTLGKGDDCDIILADATLPDAPLTLQAASDGVTLDGAPLEPLHVKTAGATSFAVGPAGSPWGELQWPERESSKVQGQKVEGRETEGQKAEETSRGDAETRSNENAAPARPAGAPLQDAPKNGGKRCGCLLSAVLLLLLLLALAWLILPRLRSAGCGDASLQPSTDRPSTFDLQPSTTLPALAERFGLSLTNRAGRTVLSGDFETRAERLRATAEAYAAQPGIELDFADAESLKTATEDIIAMLDDAAGLRVAAVTNRVAVLTGGLSSPVALTRILEAIAADVPKLRDVDVSEIVSHRGTEETATQSLKEVSDSHKGNGLRASAASAPLRDKISPALPVCGILTTPYPCLVLTSGARVLEGAPFGDWIVAKIAADSVTLTNAERSVTWKP